MPLKEGHLALSLGVKWLSNICQGKYEQINHILLNFHHVMMQKNLLIYNITDFTHLHCHCAKS